MDDTTFKSRVASFWQWYAQHAERFYQAIEAGKCPDLTEEVSTAVHHWLPHFAWVFGPGENGVGHSFTLSGEGDLNRQFLSEYWLSCAPELPGWTFYSSRQPSQIDGQHQIEIGSFRFAAGDIQIQTSVDQETEKIHIRAWHPSFPECDENLRYTVLFIWLDEALGETGTQSYIGEIEIAPLEEGKSIPVTELKQFADNVDKALEWEKSPPSESYAGYQIPEPSLEFPRADTIAGHTCHMNLIGEYLKEQGKLEAMLPPIGASFVYIKIDPTVFPKGEQVELRGKIEDELTDTLKAHASGRVIGAAFGLAGGYIDLLIFDEQNSVALIDQVMRQFNLADRYSLHAFCSE